MKSSKTLRPWASLLVQTGARACTVKSVMGMTDTECKRLFLEVRGEGSTSGQTPTSPEWFTQSAAKVYSSALFLALYEQSAKAFKDALPKADLAKSNYQGKAFAHAYYHFWRIMGSDYPQKKPSDLVAARADFLRRFYRAPSENKAALCDLKVHVCKLCQTRFLGLTKNPGRTCPICSKE